MYKRKDFTIIALLLTIGLPLTACAGPEVAMKGKPLSPLMVSIRPVQAGLASADIRPGDVVQLEIVALSHIGLSRADLRVTLAGGAKLMAGDDRWSGPMKEGSEKIFTVTIAAPKSGRGEVKAVLSAGGFRAGAQFSLGPEQKNKTGKSPGRGGVKTKDSKGNDIIEFR